jgi:hypothetical protein
MIQIRNNVFETNSSSSHCLVYKIHPGREKDVDVAMDERDEWNDIHQNWAPIQLDDNYGDDVVKGVFNIWFGQYGWVGKPVKTSRAKLAYLMTQIVGGSDLCFYPNSHSEEPIEIKTQKDWNMVIKKYVETNPSVQKVLAIVKKICPKIKKFRFSWMNWDEGWSMIWNQYRNFYIESEFKSPLGTPMDMKYTPGMLSLDDKFFTEIFVEGNNIKLPNQGYYLRTGLGDVDHNSQGFWSYDPDFIERYLTDINIMVTITNDNE